MKDQPVGTRTQLINVFLNLIAHQFTRDIFIYTLSNILRASLPFLLLPILTRYLSPKDYGIITTIEILLSLTTILVGVNAYGAVAVNFFKMKKEDLAIYNGTVLRVAGAMAIASGFIYYLIKPLILNQLNLFPAEYLPIIAIIAFMNVIVSLTLTLWQMREKAALFALFQNLQSLINLGLTILFIVFMNWGWLGRLWSIVISTTIFAILGIYFMTKDSLLKFKYNQTYLKDILHFGLPLIPHALGGWIMTATDRILINALIGITATGIYAVGYQIGSIMELFAQSFNSAFSPFLFKILENNNPIQNRKIIQLTYLMFIIIPVLVILLSYTIPLILPRFIPGSYSKAQDYIKWILIAGGANWMYYLVVNYIFYAKKTIYLLYTVALSSIANIVLNYILIKKNGPIGAAQATAISSYLAFLLAWIISCRVYQMPWNLSSIRDSEIKYAPK